MHAQFTCSLNGFRRRTAALFGFALMSALVAPAANFEGQSPTNPPPRRLTPPMGWSSWAAGYDCYVAPIRSIDVIDLVETLKAHGWDKLGWEYICLDDGMFDAERDANGNLQLTRGRFPGGLPWLLDYIHTNGLRAGAYLVVGTSSNCGGAGSMGHCFEDGRFLADSGFDFVKISFDSGPYTWGPEGTVYEPYREVIRGIRASTNEMFINASVHDFLPWMPLELNSWHTVPEVGDANGTFENLLRRLDFAAETAWAVRPGYFMDADFIKFPYSANQAKVEFGVHCLLQGQLLVGRFHDIMRPVVTNALAISINQDPLVIPASVVALDSSSNSQVWAKPYRRLDGSSWAFGFLNRTYAQASMQLRFKNLPLSTVVGRVKDVWTGEVLGHFTNSFSANIAPASLGLYVLEAYDPRPVLNIRRLTNGEVDLSWSDAEKNTVVLQTSTNMAQGWSDVPASIGMNATNVAPDTQTRFFRLRSPQ